MVVSAARSTTQWNDTFKLDVELAWGRSEVISKDRLKWMQYIIKLFLQFYPLEY